MSHVDLCLSILLTFAADPIAAGDHTRSVQVGSQVRPYLLHVPPSYRAGTPTPVVLALHPFAADGAMMARISGLSETADREGFLVVYPSALPHGAMPRWDLRPLPGDSSGDVGYLARILDDLAGVATVDPRRVYATGFSNGGMMCYCLAEALGDRIAAIAPVAGTMLDGEVRATRAMPVLHFHGTKDGFVGFDGRVWREPRSSRFKGVEETARFWARRNGCPEAPVTTVVSRQDGAHGLVVKRVAYGPGRDGSEVVLYVIEGGGHTWPGRAPLGVLLGAAALDLKASDLIWEFFAKHPMP